MTKHYLTSQEMVKGYRHFEETRDISSVAKLLKCSYSNVRLFVREISSVLSGRPAYRKHGRQNILDAVYVLQRDLPTPKTDFETVPPYTITETSEQKMNRLFEQLKTAISDWTYELVEERNKELVETAQRSNIVDFLKQGLKR